MSKSGSFDFGELRDFQKKLENFETAEKEFSRKHIKGLAARLLGMIINATPVGQKPSFDGLSDEKAAEAQKHWEGYTGGTLQRGWTSKTEEDARAGKGKPNAKDRAVFAAALPIAENGKEYTVELVNPVKYATYVENGHMQQAGRYVPALGKTLTRGWVEGKHTAEKSESAFRPKIDGITEKAFEKFLKEYFGNG